MQMPHSSKIGNSEILDLQINGMVPKAVNIEQKSVQEETEKRNLKEIIKILRISKRAKNRPPSKVKGHALLYCRHDATVSGRGICRSSLVPKKQRK